MIIVIIIKTIYVILLKKVWNIQIKLIPKKERNIKMKW